MKRHGRQVSVGPEGPRLGRRLALVLLALGALGVGGLATLRTGPDPHITIEPGLSAIGPSTPVRVRVAGGGRGLSDVHLELVQGERSWPVGEARARPRAAWALWGPRSESVELSVALGAREQEGLEEGHATLRVTAERAGTWLLQPGPRVAETELPVRLRPPGVSVISAQNYAAQGGAGVVVYHVSGEAARDGVQAGDWFFPSEPLPEAGEGTRFALYGVPYDLDDPAQLRLVAEDALGNRAERPFVDRYFPHPLKHDTIRLSESFMARVVPEILARSPGVHDQGDLLRNYLAVNGELRRQNAARLVELGERSAPRFLWSRPFLPLPGGKVMSSFADRRTYVLDGADVDHQDHLGFDLASTSGAPVPASNAGIVVLADYFGIYGNTVVIDHGHGLMTLYAHLSAIEVKAGDTVERGQVIGRTGQTGLAGGDHLHFTVLLRGLAVNPVEWWDAHWIADRIASKLGSALEFEP